MNSGKRYSQEEITRILEDHDQGMGVTALREKYGINKQSVYNWRSQRKRQALMGSMPKAPKVKPTVYEIPAAPVKTSAKVMVFVGEPGAVKDLLREFYQ